MWKGWACEQQGTASAVVEIGNSVSVDPLEVLFQNPSSSVWNAIRHMGSVAWGLSSSFHNPYAHTLPVPHHCCKVHFYWHALIQHNWLIFWSFHQETEHPHLPVCLYTHFPFSSPSLPCISTLAVIPASVNRAYSERLDLTWKLKAIANERVRERKRGRSKLWRNSTTTMIASVVSSS